MANFTLSTEEKNGTGQERFKIINEKLQKTGAILNEEEALELLDVARMDGHKYYEPGHMYYDSKTQWSVVYNLSKCTASVCAKSDYEKVYKFNLFQEKTK